MRMKETRKYIRKCPQCGQKLLKNGNENGKQRWRCLRCGTARIRSRVDVANQNRQKTYTKHLLGKSTANEMARSKGISRRTFDRRYTTGLQGLSGVGSASITTHSTGESQPTARFIVIDAKRLNQGIIAIARSDTGRLHWRYAAYESSDVWYRVFLAYADTRCSGPSHPLPASCPPIQAIVSDGQKGIQLAARLCFGEQIILQRCHFHVKQNLRVKLTKHPATAAGQDLQLLAAWLARVTTWDDMALFVGIFYGLYEVYDSFLKERTYYRSTVNGKQRWNYTHARVRSAYRQIDDLIESDQLFAYITHPELHLPNTTNHIEGGLNTRISELMRAHRGLLPERQRQMIDVFLGSKQPCKRPYSQPSATPNSKQPPR